MIHWNRQEGGPLHFSGKDQVQEGSSMGRIKYRKDQVHEGSGA